MNTQRVAVVAVTRNGARLAGRLGAVLPCTEIWVTERFAGEAGPEARTFAGPVSALVGRLFTEIEGLVLILATGAAVRLIAPYLRDKATDPAVVTVDDAGRYAISLLSGHVGGGNALARRVADALGAKAVITTASEVHGLPPADLIGQQFGWRIEQPEHLKTLAAALVNGDPVALYQDAGEPGWHPGPLPAHVTRYGTLDALRSAQPRAAIVITDRLLDEDVPDGWVVYRPRSLVLGIGCSRGATETEIATLVDTTLAEAGLSASCVAWAATIDLKRDEPGLLAFAAARGLELRFFGAAELDRTPGQQSPSAIVRAAVGTRGVCEPAALLAAGAPCLLLPKRKSHNVTVAVARRV